MRYPKTERSVAFVHEDAIKGDLMACTVF